MMSSFRFDRIGIIGAGRVANALALGLAPHSAQAPLLWNRSPQRLQDALRGSGAREAAQSLHHLTRDCDVIALAVADDALTAVAADLATAMMPDASRFIFHVSGQSGAAILEPLRVGSTLTAAIHPAMTFTGDPAREVQLMAEARFAITGSTPEATERARGIVELLGGVAVEVPEDRRPLYHAGLCHASNHLVALISGASAALKQAGVDDPGALLAPLVRAALENSINHGIAGLSGPLLRGDAQTIENHLVALGGQAPELLPVYRAMALATLDELERAGPSSARPALRRTLTES